MAPERRRGLVMGIYATTLAVGFAGGPILLAMIGTTGWLPFVIGALIILAAMMPVIAAARWCRAGGDLRARRRPLRADRADRHAGGAGVRRGRNRLDELPAAARAPDRHERERGGAAAHRRHAGQCGVPDSARLAVRPHRPPAGAGRLRHGRHARRTGDDGGAAGPAASWRWCSCGAASSPRSTRWGSPISARATAAPTSPPPTPPSSCSIRSASRWGPPGLGAAMDAWNPWGFPVALAAALGLYTLVVVVRRKLHPHRP